VFFLTVTQSCHTKLFKLVNTSKESRKHCLYKSKSVEVISF